MGLSRCALSLLFCLSFVAIAQQSPAHEAHPPSRETPDQNRPALAYRPPPDAGIPNGRIILDVLVTDDSGQPVEHLEQKDFALLDNKKPQPILSFRAVDGSMGSAGDPPVEIILLIDGTNSSLQNVAYKRSQIGKSLRQNGGHLAQPVTLMIFSELGVRVGRSPLPMGT